MNIPLEAGKRYRFQMHVENPEARRFCFHVGTVVEVYPGADRLAYVVLDEGDGRRLTLQGLHVESWLELPGEGVGGADRGLYREKKRGGEARLEPLPPANGPGKEGPTGGAEE